MKPLFDVFSDRVDYYAAYRPGFSSSLLAFIVERCALTPKAVLADLGSGTGALASLFLEYGNTVFAVEPNAAMRIAAEQSLSNFNGFRSVAASAEATMLPTASLDLVTVGRAMQWFDAEAALTEMSRILRPGGWAVVVWNEMRPSPQVSTYRDIVRTYCSNYDVMAERRQAARDLLERRGFGFENLENRQQLSLMQLKGLVLSLSGSPGPGHMLHEEMLRSVEELFTTYAADGHVNFDFDTMVYYGRTPFRS